MSESLWISFSRIDQSQIYSMLIPAVEKGGLNWLLSQHSAAICKLLTFNTESLSKPSRTYFHFSDAFFVAFCHMNDNWEFFILYMYWTWHFFFDKKKKREELKYLTKSSNLKRYFWCSNVYITDIMMKQRFRITYFCLLVDCVMMFHRAIANIWAFPVFTLTTRRKYCDMLMM